MNIVIIKYNAGNIRSVDFALRRLGVEANVTDDPQEIIAADRVIFPGVGEASSAMKYLSDKQLDKVITELRQPVLGICLGMQLMCARSEENDTDCLGIFNQQVKRFTSDNLKVPQIGWNSICELKSGLFNNVSDGEFVYFVHGYYVEKSANSIAVANYGIEYSAAIAKKNFFATQFHPEKSGKIGQRILENFISGKL